MLARPPLLNAACLLLFACAGCESLARWKAERGVAVRREQADAIAASFQNVDATVAAVRELVVMS